ncbi:hypothetical protein H5392_05360 [Tessaracoccus sp. MC1865]|uniref:hypothetical protein n=1 Tax=Tessaracoccus sp. MC1865 TaxID=2760310 RepID=UPI0016015928|nr:hypothetical protein [Tessaracoccus sp. MC1865]MBB1483292.1 hypothetical protein [Tessaracoccus sp. MC1865]QTO37296.1 hypothetical protein J7D54_12850 [Tessaracoccus sp. MC1865]
MTLPAKQHTFALSDAVGKERGAFLGACRVYPPGDSWEINPMGVPLRLARSAEERRAQPGLIERDIRAALDAAWSNASLPSAPPAPLATPVPRPARRLGPQYPSVQAEKPAQPATHLVQVDTAAAAASLAQHLVSAQRPRPVVVVTRATGAPAAFVDLDSLRNDLAGLADVAEITTAEASWTFSGQVPDLCQVYGGASRVYPIGDEWTRDPYLSPLRFAYSLADKVEVTRQLISDAMSMAARGGLTLASGPAEARMVEGIVQGVAGDRGIVSVPGDSSAVLWPELVLPGLPAERLFCKGMEITGLLDPESRRVDLREATRSAAEAVAGYRDGDTILARVAAVDQAGCDVELFPGDIRRVAAEDLGDERAAVSSLVAVGDVVPLWLGQVDGGEWMLSLLDAGDPSEAVPAPSILVGGPPWLVPQEPAPEDPAADDHPDEPGDLSDAGQRERAQLVKRLRATERRVEELGAQLQNARAALRDAEKRLRRKHAQVSENARLFDNDADQLDFEIRHAWALMTTPSEKRVRRLKKWRYSDHFFATVAEVEGVSRDKVVEVLVHVLTGLDAELTSRGRHQLRTGEGGDAPSLVRPGGETAWRVSLQVNAPSARRLHYWVCNDGSIELSSVRLHDDMRV